MKKLLWFAAGIAIGLAATKQLNENPKAQELAADLTKRAKDFGTAIGEGFREREAELDSISSPSNK